MQRVNSRRTAERWQFVGLWLLIGLIAAGACSLKWPSAHLGDEPLPYTIDSFYHARRILDTVADPSAFYEFDPRIHAPEGSLLNWPWGYDYGMAWLVKAAHALGLPGSPIAILVWLPVLAVFIPIGLIMLIGRRLGLATGFVVIAALSVALSPLTQFLHGVGAVDHHFAEYIFVLATIASGLRWFGQREDARAAAVCGVVLGAAPAIHNGMFILQLPVLISMLALWLQAIRFPLRSTAVFGLTLVATTLAVLIPSLPFRLGHFEFYTLSWFHLYVAAGSAVAAIALAGLALNRRSVAVLAGIAFVMLLPLVSQIVIARAFLVGKIARLETIVEMRSLAQMVVLPDGRMDLTLMYSMLIWLTPFTILYCAWRGWRERTTQRVFFWICCVLGLALLLTQLRMHYFGSFALFLPWLLLAQDLATRWTERHKLILLVTAVVFLLAYWMPARYQLASVSAPAGDPSFRALRPVLDDLHKACAEDPGIVLADNDVGHYIRYYTECSVIANNFLLTRQHEAKIRQIDYLTSLPASALPGAAPFVRYVLLRPVSILRGETETTYMSFSQRAAPLINDLLLQPLARVPSNYVLIEQVNLHEKGEEESFPYIRLYKIDPVAPLPRTAASLKPVVH